MSLKEEWITALKSKDMFNTDVYSETYDWWLNHFRTMIEGNRKNNELSYTKGYNQALDDLSKDLE